MIKFLKGLHQGDSLSPCLFIFVIDVFARILKRASNLDIIEGIGSHPSFICIESLLCWDTLIFYVMRDDSVKALKAILLRFEDASGFKVNFTKDFL